MRSGLTLLEVTFTVLVTGIVAAVALVRFGEHYDRYQVRSAADQLIADLGYIRRQARMKGQDVEVVFDVAAQTMTCNQVADPDHPAQTFTVDFSQREPRVPLLSAVFANGNTVTFTRFGTALPGGQITLGTSHETVLITVDPDTGEATR